MIITYPNQILRKKSKSVQADLINSAEIKKLIQDMRYWIKKAGGVGLAAVQIGALKRIILVEIEEGKPIVFINPQITKKSWKKTAIEEACLSVPDKSGYVKRSEKIHLKAIDENGKKIKFKVSGLTSIIFQHEIDHLNGVLFIDKIWKK